MVLNTGVYRIVNIVTNDFYIGSTGSKLGFKGRKFDHFNLLKKNKHPNRYLQNSYNKYKNYSFKFEILVRLLPQFCIEVEQFYIDTLNPPYNIRKIAKSNLGIKRSIESIEKHKNSICIYTYKIKQPDGNIVETNNLNQYCRDNNLSHFENGKIKNHHIIESTNPTCKISNNLSKSEALLGINKGRKWRNESKYKAKNTKHKYIYTIQCPDNSIIEIIYLKDFCAENKLNYKCLILTLKGLDSYNRTYSQHRNYKIIDKKLRLI